MGSQSLTLCDPTDGSPPGSPVLAFSRQEYWSGLPVPSPGDLPDPGIKPGSPVLHQEVALMALTPCQLLDGDWASQVVLVIKNPPANAGDIRDVGSIPGSGRSPGVGTGNQLQYSCLENPMDRETWQVTVHGVTTEVT